MTSTWSSKTAPTAGTSRWANGWLSDWLRQWRRSPTRASASTSDACDPQLLGQHLSGVLARAAARADAQQGSRSNGSDSRASVIGPRVGCSISTSMPTLPQVLVLEDLTRVEHRSGGHAGLSHGLSMTSILGPFDGSRKRSPRRTSSPSVRVIPLSPVRVRPDRAVRWCPSAPGACVRSRRPPRPSPSARRACRGRGLSAR